MERAMSYVKGSDPIGAYAVEEITYDLGISSGQMALAVDIQYIHNRTDIRRIVDCSGMDAARACIAKTLNNCEAGIVLRVRNYEETDITQLVQDYADEYPEYVMEQPQVTVNTYPEQGTDRVLELKFSYQTSREALREMQSRVHPLFSAAKLYVTGENAPGEKYAQLYAFLMERTTYEVQTSITPAYSLLHHSVGDSKAFAVVYAAMCRWAGLECMVISGTKDGDARFWNIICQDNVYYHLDLLQANSEGKFVCHSDAEMQNYVWDYSAYPPCGIQPEATQPATE
jgi:transglutaminase/protease-like cytokinesis protein 3